MKSKGLFLIILFILITSFSSCSKFSGNDWAAKIDDDKITIDEFMSFYYLQNKLLLNIEKNEEVDKLAEDTSVLSPQVQQYIVKTTFLDQLIAQKLLYKKAFQDDTVDQKELKIAEEIGKMQAVSAYYLGKKLKGKVEVTNEEVEKFYKRNKKLFRGVPIDENIIRRIKQQIFLQKSKLKSNEYLMTLIAESKVNKEGLKNYLKKMRENKDKNKEQNKTKEKKDIKKKK
ncbi:hypothetical protein ACFL20_00135 [Spirochaetota bacterium]